MPNVKLPGKCDVCTKRDGFKNHNLQRCKTCYLLVHESCNGMVATAEKNPEWECLACESLRWDPKERDGVRQIERPTECCFCSVSEGIHAMHPLYDIHGKAGKQIILPATNERNGLNHDISCTTSGASTSKPRKLAWVHTLCGFFIGSYSRTAGMVYSCDADGDFSGEDNEDEDDEEESESNESAKDSEKEKHKKKKGSNDKQRGTDDDNVDDDEEGGFAQVHRFVVNNEKPWANILKGYRSIKCSICGLHDKKGKSLKIALQCCAGDEFELPSYSQRHSADPSKPCYVGFHVGCARWMGGPVYPRVFFYPGANPIADDAGDDKFPDPVTCAYCDAHARDIWNGKPKYASPAKQHPRTATMKAPPTIKDDSSTVTATGNETSSTKSVAEVPKRQKVAATSPLLPQQAARLVASSASLAQSAAEKKADAEGCERWFTLVRDDVLRVIEEERGKNKNVAKATSRRRVFWKEKSALPKSQFKLLWARVKDAVEAEVLDGPGETNGSKVK